MAARSSIFSDLSGYVERVARLARLDAALLVIETKENLLSAGISIGLIAGALFIASLGLVILALSVVFLLIQLGLLPALAAFLVAVALFLVTAIMAFVGLKRLKSWNLTPRRTLTQFNNNLQALRASLRDETNS